MSRSPLRARRKGVTLALCFCLLLGIVSGVFAYLSANTDLLSNRFVPARVSCRVEESFQDGVKSQVRIRNTGNAKAYLRAVVVATFIDENGKVLALSPKEGEHYSLTWTDEGWFQGADGFRYHSDPVAPDGLSAELIETATVISVPEGCRLNLQILASAVQSDPEKAVWEAWGIRPVNGRLLPAA